jgi:hypothetical protein
MEEEGSRGRRAMDFRWARTISLISVFGLGLGTASSAAAQAYVWKDEDGGVHMSDSLHDVPAKYRGQVEQRKLEGIQVQPGLGKPNVPGQPAPKDPDSFWEIMRKAVTDGVNQQLPKMPEKQRGVIVEVVMEHMSGLLLSLGVNFLATAFAFIHAIVNRHPVWAVFHAFTSFSVPIYAFVEIDSVFHKFMTILGWAAYPLTMAGTWIAIARALEMSNRPFV